ncbi:MAG: 5-formyltetrahydrofolate cyclo-ligase [Spirochaetaceae bacterium]|jgi:5-formyltetrahydrofolate cyclo-ligase|nr:5-formyltetrahydrofolate cyclo-ligase [Spirochaetaceae bacterium]
MNKKELRTLIRQNLRALPKEQFKHEGLGASKNLLASPVWKKYDTVLVYLSLPDEIDTSVLLDNAFREGKAIYAPKVESTGDMRFFRLSPDPSLRCSGAFGIREPAGKEEDLFQYSEKPVLVIAPGLAFDREGNRLGRGRGFYDRFCVKLFKESPESCVCAFCMSSSLIDHVTVDPFDCKVNAICTKDEFLLINKRQNSGRF